MIKPADFGVSYLGTVYFTSEDYIVDHAQQVQAFVDSLIEGWDVTYSDSTRAIPMIASFDPKTLTADLIRFNLEKQKQFILPPGARYCDFSEKSWQVLNENLVDLKLLNTLVDLRTATTTKFLDRHYHRTVAM